jgi:hypothetical protein
MRTLLISSLALAGVLGTSVLMAGCVPEEPTTDDSVNSGDSLKKGGCHGRRCDGGTDPAVTDSAAPATDASVTTDAAPAATCSSFTYSTWEACQPDGTQSRTVVIAMPEGCMGGTPVLEQTCVYTPPPPPVCTTFMYSAYGPCQPDNTQSRTVVSALPDGCMGGTPVLKQACTYVAPVVTCTSFTYSAYGECQPNNTQSRTVVSSSPSGCTGGTPIVSQACTYVPPPPATCTSFTYTEFGACQPNNTQTRTVLSSSPMGCAGGTPVLSQVCTYVPPAARDYKTFDGTSLTANRVVAAIGADRRRVKPYSALKTEYPRVLASTPASLAGAERTFTAVTGTRWYEEATASSVELQKSLDIAFDGCLTYTGTAAQYGVAPTTSTATTECTAMARKFWSRAPSATEVQECVAAAIDAAAAETNARRKWAYACASVLTSAGFLTY